jgi:hypothetical protein
MELEEGSTPEVLDARARHEYEQRIRDLQAEIDDAERNVDEARVDRPRLEMDALVDELTAALGFGGHARHRGGSVERARSAVTQRIRSTIRDLGAAPRVRSAPRGVDQQGGPTACTGREPPVSWRR